jgi:hypothetical protein
MTTPAARWSAAGSTPAAVALAAYCADRGGTVSSTAESAPIGAIAASVTAIRPPAPARCGPGSAPTSGAQNSSPAASSATCSPACRRPPAS